MHNDCFKTSLKFDYGNYYIGIEKGSLRFVDIVLETHIFHF